MNAPAAAGPPVAVPGPADMAAQTPFGRLKCHDCHRPVGASPGFGFCRTCGAPLCGFCASSNAIDADGNRAVPIPLILLVASPSAAINPVVTLCCDCWERSSGRNARLFLKFVLGSVIIALFFGLLFIGRAGRADFPFAVCGTLFFTLISIIPVYWICRYLDFREYRPTCPVCGRSAMPFWLRGASRIRTGFCPFPDFIECGCGYRGQRMPLDGLWLFVQKNGWEPLAGGPLENMGRASAFATRDRRWPTGPAPTSSPRMPRTG